MKKISFVLILLFTITFCFAQTKEENLVRESFNNYKSSILNDKGEEAVRFVDSRTVGYYSEILELVKNAESSQVATLSLLDKLMVFTIRHRASREDIMSFDGKGLLVYAINSGMVGKNSVSNNSVGEVTVNQHFAKGQFIANGQKAPFFFHFYKEDGQWKLDLTALFPVSGMALKKMVEDSGLSESEYIFSLLEVLTGRKPGQEIWRGINENMPQK